MIRASPEMINVYSGSVTTDSSGEASVTLPPYFGALNKDFRYQLTVQGTFAQAIIDNSTFAVFGSRADAGDGGSGALFPCRTWLA